MDVKEILVKNRALKNRHAGQRCFVLGCGHSLNKLDLKPLRDEICLGMSRFYKHPDYQWIAPQYYCEGQYHLPYTEDWWQGFMRELAANTGNATMFFGLNDFVRNQQGGFYRDRELYFLEFSGNWDEAAQSGIDLSRPVPGVIGMSIMTLQVALYLGFKEIFLLGFDHDIILKRAHSIHFYDEERLAYIDEYVDFDLEEQCLCHLSLWRQYKVLRQLAQRQGSTIYNATPGGLLDLFPRVNLATVLAHKNEPPDCLENRFSPEMVREIKKIMHSATEQIGSGVPAEALKILSQLAFLSVEIPGVHYLMSVCYRTLGVFRKALDEAEAELRINPEHPGVKQQIDFLKSKLGA